MNIHLTLDTGDLLQTLDALEIRAEAWEKTERYHSTGESSDDILIEECTDAHEARQIATHYRSIIAKIRKQLSSGAKS
jgi:hypothetical protein